MILLLSFTIEANVSSRFVQCFSSFYFLAFFSSCCYLFIYKLRHHLDRCWRDCQPGRNFRRWDFSTGVWWIDGSLVYPNNGWSLLDARNGWGNSSFFIEKVLFAVLRFPPSVNFIIFLFLEGRLMLCSKWNGSRTVLSASAQTTASLSLRRSLAICTQTLKLSRRRASFSSIWSIGKVRVVATEKIVLFFIYFPELCGGPVVFNLVYCIYLWRLFYFQAHVGVEIRSGVCRI